MKKFNLLSLINTGLIIIILIFGIQLYKTSHKKTMAYVDNIKLFNSFNMVKDSKTIEERKINAKGKALDSLYMIFQSITDKESETAKNLQLKIATGSKEMQDMQHYYTNNLSQQVWSRLNGYIKDYSEQNNLSIVFGSNGNGNVMFAAESLDITSDFIEFSNRKYEGN